MVHVFVNRAIINYKDKQPLLRYAMPKRLSGYGANTNVKLWIRGNFFFLKQGHNSKTNMDFEIGSFTLLCNFHIRPQHYKGKHLTHCSTRANT